MCGATDTRNRYIRFVFLAALLVLVSGCGALPEATFTLAPESRLPKWFTSVANIDRSTVTLQLDYFIDSTGSKAVFTLLDHNGNVVLRKSGHFGKSLEDSVALPAGPAYPAHQVVVIDGVTDIVEHRKMEPMFYMTDDPSVWAKVRSDADI